MKKCSCAQDRSCLGRILGLSNFSQVCCYYQFLSPSSNFLISEQISLPFELIDHSLYFDSITCLHFSVNHKAGVSVVAVSTHIAGLVNTEFRIIIKTSMILVMIVILSETFPLMSISRNFTSRFSSCRIFYRYSQQILLAAFKCGTILVPLSTQCVYLHFNHLKMIIELGANYL